ncbi:MFS transporter [Nesterenkonia alkaliphila]|uniref:MFS transporter n=1 Tax=Nesterenkonia alkaliphila TaxID=1463631 RepID=A0A7K1UHH9_9MICC|nr:MFS transporter [Nesterenkonia alkaliphila]MVT25920.1 MFS transporter [Nesterenkonia alkaliphila]
MTSSDAARSEAAEPSSGGTVDGTQPEAEPGMRAPGQPTRRVMFALLLPLFAALLSISSVIVAAPVIVAGIGASESDLQWILTGYALAFGMGLVPAGRAGDLWGRRGMFLAGTGFFGLTSAAAALAPSPELLIVARVLMGLASSMLLPRIIGVIQQLFTGAARGQAYGLMATVIGLGVALGPLVGGLLVELAPEEYSWRLVFGINVPIGLLGVVLGVLWLPRRRAPRARASGNLRQLDPIGVLLLTAAIVLIMLPFIQLRGGWGVVAAAAGVLLAAGWVLWERRLGRRRPEDPMVDLRLFTLPSYTWNSAILVLYFLGMPAMWAVIPIYLQDGLGHSALTAGIVSLPSGLMVLLLASGVGKRVPRWGTRMLVLGSCTAVLAVLMLAGAVHLMGSDYGSLWWIAVAIGVSGFSQALLIPSAQTLSMQDVPEQMAGASGGVQQTVQRIFTAMGMAVATGVYFLVAQDHGHQQAMVISALLIAAAMSTSVLAAVGAARAAKRTR